MTSPSEEKSELCWLEMYSYRGMSKPLTALLFFAGCLLNQVACAEPFVLRIGSDYYEPFNYLDAEGEFAGVDVELAREACRRLECEPVFINLDWPRKNEYLDKGTVDCLWGSFTMTGRENEYRWAGPYMASYQAVMVWADSPIRTLSDLKGKSVAVQTTTKPEELFLSGKDKRLAGLSALFSFPELADAAAALRKGYVDAAAGHKNALLQYVPVEGESHYRILSEYLLKAHLGVAFSKTDQRGIDRKLTAVLEQMRDDGTVALIAKKYGITSW